MDKPDGFFLIKPEDAEQFLEELEIKRFFGVGERTEEKMHRLNIFRGRDLKAFERDQLIRHFGKAGNYFYEVVRGIDERPVVPFRESKSIGAERTYDTDLFDMQQVEDRLTEVSGHHVEALPGEKKVRKDADDESPLFGFQHHHQEPDPKRALFLAADRCRY